jgi:hypothetical protein
MSTSFLSLKSQETIDVPVGIVDQLAEMALEIGFDPLFVALAKLELSSTMIFAVGAVE